MKNVFATLKSTYSIKKVSNFLVVSRYFKDVPGWETQELVILLVAFYYFYFNSQLSFNYYFLLKITIFYHNLLLLNILCIIREIYDSNLGAIVCNMQHDSEVLYNDMRYMCGINIEQNKDVTKKIIYDIALCRYYGIAGTELFNIIFLLHSTSDISGCADIRRGM